MDIQSNVTATLRAQQEFKCVTKMRRDRARKRITGRYYRYQALWPFLGIKLMRLLPPNRLRCMPPLLSRGSVGTLAEWSVCSSCRRQTIPNKLKDTLSSLVKMLKLWKLIEMYRFNPKRLKLIKNLIKLTNFQSTVNVRNPNMFGF